MNNPFTSFDLEESLSGLPAALRQPMVMAVGASALVHSLFFVALPAVTTSSPAQKTPERIVNVIELTPEEQARLPQTLALNQLPLSSAGSLGKLPPLTGLLPGSKSKSTVKVPPLPSSSSSTDDFLRQLERQSSSSSIFPPLFRSRRRPIYRPVTPPTPEPQPAPKKKKKSENDPESEKQPKPNESKEKLPDLEAGKEGLPENSPMPPKTPKGGPASEGGAKKLGGTTPVSTPTPTPKPPSNMQLLAEGRQRLAARTYDATQTTAKYQQERQQTVTDNLLTRLKAEQLQQLPKSERDAVALNFGMAANGMDQPIKLEPVEPQLSPGQRLEFNGQERPALITAVVQAYFAPDGSLLLAEAVEGQSDAVPVIMRSSGFPILDQQAIALVQAKIKEEPPQGKYQTVRYEVTFNLPQVGEA